MLTARNQQPKTRNQQPEMKTLGIIPARYESTRFPGKPLAEIAGKSMIQRVFERASGAQLDELVVATDDRRIFDHVRSFGGSVEMTSPNHPSGTSRCAEVAFARKNDFDLVLNIQGDEPFIDPGQLNLLIESFDPEFDDIATLACKIENDDELKLPGHVKVVCDVNSHALYFSRSVIPFARNTENGKWATAFPYLLHMGIYAYRSDILQQLSGMKPSLLEKTESLEQLNWLYHGLKIRVIETVKGSISIDTPEDLAKAVQMMR